MSHHTAPEELKDLLFLGVYSSLASPSGWDGVEGDTCGVRVSPEGPALLWEGAGISVGYGTQELLRVPRCCPLLPVPHITAQALAKESLHLIFSPSVVAAGRSSQDPWPGHPSRASP